MAEIDAVENDFPQEIRIHGYPSIVLFPAGGKRAGIAYDGERTVEALMGFVRSHVTHKFELRSSPTVSAQSEIKKKQDL